MYPTSMLELQKLVLENVFENKSLFAKELQKSFQWLEHDDLYVLYNWVIGKFNERYQNIINDVYLGFNFQDSNIVKIDRPDYY